MNINEAVNERVLNWARARGWDVAELLSVEGRGSDWAGDTMNGFYEEFEVAVTFFDSEGQRQLKGVGGEEMQSLWRYVMSDEEPKPSPPMKSRVIRVPDSLWNEAKRQAETRNEDVSKAVRRLLQGYVREQGKA